MADRSWIAVAALGSLLCSGAAPSWAEEVPLTLAEALSRAGQSGTTVVTARALADAARERAEAARKLSWPRLTLDSRVTASDAPAMVFAQRLDAGRITSADFDPARLIDPGASWHLGTTLGAEAPIDLFGRIRAATRAQQASARSREAVARSAEQGMRLAVTDAYWRAALGRRAVEVARRALAAATSREQEIQVRAEQGDALTADLLRARARRLEREAELAAREGDVRVASANLSRLLSAPEGESLVPSEQPPQPAPPTGTLAEWLARSAARPELLASRERQAAADGATRAEQLSSRPEALAALALRDDRRSGGGGQSFIAAVGLRWSLDPARSRKLAAAQADSRVASSASRQAADGVRLEVETAHARQQAAFLRWQASKSGGADLQEALRVVRERRLAGLATLTDELETEAAALAAEWNEIAAAADAAVAEAALRYAAGEL